MKQNKHLLDGTPIDLSTTQFQNKTLMHITIPDDAKAIAESVLTKEQYENKVWHKTKRRLLIATMLYMRSVDGDERQTFENLETILNAAQIDDAKDKEQTMLDKIFKRFKETNPDNPAHKYYINARIGPKETFQTIAQAVQDDIKKVINIKE